MTPEKDGENRPSETEILYYIDALDHLFRDTGKFSKVLENMVGAGEELAHLYEDGALGVLAELKLAVDKARPGLQDLAEQILANSQEEDDGEKKN